MAIRVDVGYTYDASGRMLLSNGPREAERHAAPHLFLGRTRGGYVVRFGATVPDNLARQLEAIIDQQHPVRDLRAPPDGVDALREALGQHSPLAKEGGGPNYRFPDSITRSDEVVQVTEANREIVRETYPWLYEEWADWWPCFAAVRDSAAVSVCFSSRIGAAAMEAGVYTLPDFRGRGYAAAVTAAWGAAIRESGRIPLYSTAWDNLASQGVARRVGLILFGADTTWA